MLPAAAGAAAPPGIHTGRGAAEAAAAWPLAAAAPARAVAPGFQTGGPAKTAAARVQEDDVLQDCEELSLACALNSGVLRWRLLCACFGMALGCRLFAGELCGVCSFGSESGRCRFKLRLVSVRLQLCAGCVLISGCRLFPGELLGVCSFGSGSGRCRFELRLGLSAGAATRRPVVCRPVSDDAI